jgi:hypothetical protein
MPDPFDRAAERAPSPRPFSLSAERGVGAGPADRPLELAETAAGPMSRHAAEWGLAALLGGGFLMVTAAVVLLFNLTFWNAGSNVVSTADMRLAFAGGVIGVLALLGLCMASLTIGARALQSAMTRRQPAGLALAGTMISAGALVLWIITGADLLMILLTFVR